MYSGIKSIKGVKAQTTTVIHSKFLHQEKTATLRMTPAFFRLLKYELFKFEKYAF